MVLDLQEFGRRLRAARAEKKLTQDELAALVEAPRTWISELENGRQISLRADTVVRFARALEVSADYLLGMSDTPQAAPPKRTRRKRAPSPDLEEERLGWEQVGMLAGGAR